MRSITIITTAILLLFNSIKLITHKKSRETGPQEFLFLQWRYPRLRKWRL